SNTFCIPREIVVLFNQAAHPHGLYSAVDTGMTFFSLPSFILKFLPPSLAKPGTGAGAGGGGLNVYDAIRSSVIHSRRFRERQGKGPLLGVCGLEIPQYSDLLSEIDCHLRIARCSGLTRRPPT